MRLDLADKITAALGQLDSAQLEALVDIAQRVDSGDLSSSKVANEVKRDEGLRALLAGWDRADVIALLALIALVVNIILTHSGGSHPQPSFTPEQFQQIISELRNQGGGVDADHGATPPQSPPPSQAGPTSPH